MNNKNAVSKKVLFDHFAGLSTPLEKASIEEWLNKPDNVEFYYHCLNAWENENLQYVADSLAAFEQINTTKNEQTVSINTTASVKKIGKRLAIAAAVLVAICCTLFLEKDRILNKTVNTTYGEVKQIVLPDGSTVTLNANSEIKYARFNFADNTREVNLNGEADFSVIHTKSNQKFIVKTNNKLNVTVLGTQFSVYNRNATSEVVLRKGKVELDYTTIVGNQPTVLVLKPGDKFIKNEKGADEVHLADTEKVVAWKNHDFLFEGTALADVANIVKDNFGIKLIFQNDTLASRKISGTFHAEKADELIDAIAQLLDVNYKKKNNVIYFFN
jgi:ferric-dicitrate binding protein FerR (iron transport regulator)